jgi:uncharacterized protein with ParB-like and HNH nuclease domain
LDKISLLNNTYGEIKLKANEKKFTRFLEGSDKHFVIPVYQRNYDWKKEQCKQLFNDLIDISKTNRTHFLGSIVSIYHDDGEDLEYLIIDGQQRLTTLSLLLLAIYKIIDNGLIQTNVNKEQIRDEYLINKYSKDDKKIRLKPVKNDKNAFASLFKEEDDYIQDTNITINFQYFYERILKEELSIDKLFLAIKQLIIVDIELKNGEDNPQLIFESLNSTGLDLKEADKVRNFILMKENSSIQERFYTLYWNKIEENTNYNVSDFVRDYLTIKERAIPNKSKVYLHFKNYVTNNISDIEDLLKDLLKFSTYYKKIIDSKNNTDDVSIVLNKINKLESIVTYPFIMEVFEDKDNGIICENDMKSILTIIVDFVFRRLICEVPTNALNKIFMVMGREIKKYNNYKEYYVEVFKYIITRKKLTLRFPDDEEFGLKIVQKDIYNFKSKNKLFLLEQLENFDNKERVDVENLINNTLTIEHIMPQKLTPAWRDSLGSDYEIIKEKYLHTLGNITLTGYNSKLSNKSFIEKRDMEKGFKQSRLFLNKALHNLEYWNESEIINRANYLKDRALKIWTFPNSEYQSQEDNLKMFTLNDDDVNFAGEKILSYQFMKEKENTIQNWKNFYKIILSELYNLDPIKFKQIIINNNFQYKKSSVTDMHKHFKINNFYIYSILDTETILSRLRTLTEEIGLDLNDLSFTIL